MAKLDTAAILEAMEAAPTCPSDDEALRERDLVQERERRLRGLGLRPLWWEFEFEDFEPEVDQPVMQTCREYAECWPQERGLILYSQSPGTGKSLLAACILKRVGRGWWANAAELLEAIRRSFSGTQPYIYEHSFDAPLLVIDDLGAHKVSEWTTEMFYTLLNYRIEELLPTIITTNIRDISHLIGGPVASRVFGHCDVLTLKGGDYRRRK